MDALQYSDGQTYIRTKDTEMPVTKEQKIGYKFTAKRRDSDTDTIEDVNGYHHLMSSIEPCQIPVENNLI